VVFSSFSLLVFSEYVKCSKTFQDIQEKKSFLILYEKKRNEYDKMVKNGRREGTKL